MSTNTTVGSGAAIRFLQTVVLVDDEARLLGVGESEPEPPTSGELSVDTSGVEPDAEPVAGLRIPDPIGPESGDDSLDAKVVIDRFSALGLICGVIRLDDANVANDTVGPVASRADLLVLDWWLNGDQGDVTLEIIRHVVTDLDQRHRVRLIVIYTADRDLDAVANRVAGELGASAVVEGNRVNAGPVHVTVLAKPGTNVDPELVDEVVSFHDLPDRVIAEFGEVVRGLVPSVVLSSFAAIHDNTHRILDRLSDDLDAAYLGHRILLPHPEDAEIHLADLVAGELWSVLDDAQVGNCADVESVTALVRGSTIVTRSMEPMKSEASRIGISEADYALNLVEKGIDWPESGLSGSQKGKAHTWTTGIFASDDHSAERVALRFAALMKIRSRYENPCPRLELGVFVKDRATSTLYLCVQPVCDSTRLDLVTSFPFLPLTLATGACDFVLPVGEDLQKFSVSLKLRELRTLRFKPQTNPPGTVVATRDRRSGSWVFQTFGRPNVVLEWVGVLREGWAHYWANRFADESSRVGVEDSEWARRLR